MAPSLCSRSKKGPKAVRKQIQRTLDALLEPYPPGRKSAYVIVGDQPEIVARSTKTNAELEADEDFAPVIRLLHTSLEGFMSGISNSRTMQAAHIRGNRTITSLFYLQNKQESVLVHCVTQPSAVSSYTASIVEQAISSHLDDLKTLVSAMPSIGPRAA
eukprot:Clim_evm26s215 gene=Clim_evmTU26s215